MSVNGVTGIPAALLRPAEPSRPRVEQERPAATPLAAPVETRRPGAAGLLAPRQDVLPTEAPAGTDPELWHVLTAEERAHFARMTSLGPLTYARPSTPASSGETSLARGGRIDVKA